MKNILNQLVAIIALTAFAMPAIAAEATKGTKSYQARTEKSAEAPAAATEEPKAEDAANITPAAGDTQDADAADQGKRWKEEMRLPRKN